MHNPPFHNFLLAGPGMYTFLNMHVPPHQYIISRDQVKSFVQYDAKLHSGEDIALASAMTNGSIKVNGPTCDRLVPGRRLTKSPSSLQMSSNWLSKPHATLVMVAGWTHIRPELIDNTLWDMLEYSHQHDEAIKARKERRGISKVIIPIIPVPAPLLILMHLLAPHAASSSQAGTLTIPDGDVQMEAIETQIKRGEKEGSANRKGKGCKK
ncbi:uncharacterized protein EDB93DRAFT_1101704 [Suillus bovinus]|uniref:uncharacterized protein n=1 Tax=Suillus bovinus TaxID=48563 RepID=UPI001B8711A8|nr:uncharacterized protein EDB93DRAFT_1101704 [Suillus bovinus]KAG2155938.1 hypothetical protein EDB93DRAFT_1101704 [Suillus bovinus]